MGRQGSINAKGIVRRVLSFSFAVNATTILSMSILKHVSLMLFLLTFFGIKTYSLGESEVALTVDDLPSCGRLPAGTDRLAIAQKMIEAFHKHNITGVYGFVNAKRIDDAPGTLEVLKQWFSSGHLLGNHTYQHVDIVTTSLSDYLADIKRNEPVLANIMGAADFRFFRYPFLAEGETAEKRDGVRKFLFDSGYKIAEVSMDFFDYEWVDP